ncbi:mesoderm posterior protein 1-like [Alligator mississippiensis]|uniref:mesoderm posterior protein 1-like n=1 Tax=Alligator mississippiensis TaxID=8496 RepID=UPI00287766BD|nr:mesoderm posterior protein 1-like [Alligator mississippiensis]
MASAPASLLAPSLCLPPAPALPQLWGWAPAESTSPSSSSDSFSSPPAPARDPFVGHGPRRALSLPAEPVAAPCPGRRARAGCGEPRRSASEREKLRMRTLARALRTLRHFLPPTLAPAGQSLTKIETLRLASRYIAHLSAMLGPRPPAPRRRCTLCPAGLGCSQVPGLGAASPALQEPAAEPWGSPETGSPPGPAGSQSTGAGAWVSPSSCSEAGTPPEPCGAQLWEPGAWVSPPHCPEAGAPLELPEPPAWMLPAFCSEAAADPEPDGTGAVDTRPWGSPPLPACCQQQVGHISPARDSAQVPHGCPQSAQVTYSHLQSAQAWPQEWWS